MRPLVTLLVVVLALAAAAMTRTRTRPVLGRRTAYGRPLSDWAAVSVLGLGLGLAALIAGFRTLAFLLLIAVLIESYATVSQVRFQRRRR
ncbi:MAG: hypothetical protein M3357_18555 [Actinomycetota bacterium]|nr:hypothetical protein [Actinomycetota bacterium]